SLVVMRCQPLRRALSGSQYEICRK
ncbi:acetyltransferase, partial [Vibrio tarriae]